MMKQRYIISVVIAVLLGSPSASAFSETDLAKLLSTKSCPGCDLTSAKLAGVDLAQADLSGARLGSANLAGANLSGANLSGATLTNANLRKTNLRGANLGKAIIYQAILSGADLTNANMEAAILVFPGFPDSKAKFCNTRMPDGSLNDEFKVHTSRGIECM